MKKLCIVAVLTFTLIFSGCSTNGSYTLGNSSTDSRSAVESKENNNSHSSASKPSSSANVSENSSQTTPTQTVDKSSKILPDLTDFLGKAPATSGKYQGGRRAQYQNLDATYINTATSELINLLTSKEYQLRLLKKRTTGNDGLTDRYEFKYMGSSTVSQISGKNDDYLFNVELAIYKSKKGDTFSVQLHWAPEFEIVDSGRHVSVKLHDGSGGGTGGDDIADGDVDIPEFAKLDCLTCKGDGDCTRCGGDGYTNFGDAKAGCDKCHGNGKCTACGGTGKR